MDREKMKEVRKMLGLTQQQVAKFLGTFQQTVARWETGERAVPDNFAFVLGLHTPMPNLQYLLDHPEAFTPEMDMARAVAEMRYYRDHITDVERTLRTLDDKPREETEHARRQWTDEMNRSYRSAADAAFRLLDRMTEQAYAARRSGKGLAE